LSHSRWIENILAEKPELHKFVMLLRARNTGVVTIFNYLRVIKGLMNFCEERGLQICKDSAYEFLSRYDNPRTRNRYGWAIHRYFKLMKHPDLRQYEVPVNKPSKLPNVLSEEEVFKMANVCDKVRDRALVLLTYESSRRNSEVRGLRIRDVKFDQYGAEVRFHSTKGEDANIRLILSAASLQTWIEHHKHRDDPDAYVFYGYKDQMTQERFRQILWGAAVKAGIKRRVYPHLLRHSRLAKLKREKRLSDDDIMNISGHRDRKMLDRYGRITMAMTNERLLEIEGVKAFESEKVKASKARVCPRCKHLNSPLADYCASCGMVLDEKEAQRLVDQAKELEELKRKMDVLFERSEAWKKTME
jgi:integrase/recombinase XerD